MLTGITLCQVSRGDGYTSLALALDALMGDEGPRGQALRADYYRAHGRKWIPIHELHACDATQTVNHDTESTRAATRV